MPNLAPNPIPISEAASLAGGTLARGTPSQTITSATTPLAPSGDEVSICFVTDKTLAAILPNSNRLVCVTNPPLAKLVPDKVALIVCDDNKASTTARDQASGNEGGYIKDCFVAILRVLYPLPQSSGAIHPSAAVADDAEIAPGVQLDAFVSVGKGAAIGAGSILQAGAVIGDGVVVGQHCLIEARATISHSVIGDHTHISQGASIGHCGFGLDGEGRLVPHIGRVVIGDYAYIGAGTNIDRGMLGDTEIGDQVMVDSLCHIAHNVTIGAGSVICAQSAFGGSASLGAKNTLGPRVGVVSHATIGAGNLFVAQCGVTKNVGDDTVMGGFPAVPIGEYRRQVAAIRQLTRPAKANKAASGKPGD